MDANQSKPSNGDPGAETVVDHFINCTDAKAAVVVDGSVDDDVANLVVVGWMLSGCVDYVAGKRIRFLVPPLAAAGENEGGGGKPVSESEVEPVETEVVPAGTLVRYHGSLTSHHGLHRVTGLSDLSTRTDLPAEKVAKHWPDGVAYDLWPDDIPRKFSFRERAVFFVHRDSFTVVDVKS